MLPSRLAVPNIKDPFNLTETWPDDYGTDLLAAKTSTKELLAVNDLLDMMTSLKYHLQIHCSGQAVCSKLPRLLPRKIAVKEHEVLERDLKRGMIVSKIDPQTYEGAIVLQQSQGKFIKIGPVKLFEDEWFFETDINVTEVTVFCKNSPTNDTVGLECSKCINFDSLYREYFALQAEIEDSKPLIILRDEAWVAAILSVSTVGILCSIAIFSFIIVRICKKDMLEGNPGFSFLMLLAVIFMYSSILPFSLQVVDEDSFLNGVLCGLKLLGTSLSYSLVYSVMLARSLMLASCDEDGGFMSHVNGYLQTVLCFFIAAVQIALTIQFWAMNWLLLSKEQCAYLSQGSVFLYLMSYDVFLLALLCCVSPFIMRSKRNYHEGGYFTVATLLCVLVWAGWCTGYVLLPKWADVFVCCGLVGTASIILITVFIPRTYLMLTGIVRDHLVSTLPSLVHTTSASVIDVNYR